VVAALAFSAPAWAQSANPSGGNAMGTPGPNPGGPGLTPYSSGQAAMSNTSSAMPPSHHHAHHHTAHGKVASHHPSRFPNLQGNVANQLNQAELARLQGGNMSMPAAPGMAPGMAPPAPHMSTHGTVQ